MSRRLRTSTRFRGPAALAALVIGCVGLVAPMPAEAHSGGRAVVLVRSLALVPSGENWRADVVLSDNDSGDPIMGSKVTALVGSAKPVVLASGSTPGLFQAQLPAIEPGATTFELKVRSNPGTAPVQPFDQSWPVQLVAGETATVVGGSGGGSAVPVLASAGGGVLALGLLFGLYRARRRTAVPAARA